MFVSLAPPRSTKGDYNIPRGPKLDFRGNIVTAGRGELTEKRKVEREQEAKGEEKTCFC